jgi:hypothetical protein
VKKPIAIVTSLPGSMRFDYKLPGLVVNSATGRKRPEGACHHLHVDSSIKQSWNHRLEFPIPDQRIAARAELYREHDLSVH